MKNRNIINQKISELDYNPKTVMVFNGKKIENSDIGHTTDDFDDTAYLVTTREKRSIEGDFDIAVPNAFNSVTFPGSLLLATNELLDGRPKELAAQRAPLEYTLDLPGNVSFTSAPTYQSFQNELGTSLKNWFEANGKNWSPPANFMFRSSLVYDQKQMALKFGCDVEYLKAKLGIDFSRNSKEQKSLAIVQYKQIFFTASCARPPSPADVFSDSTSWDSLLPSGIGAGSPPLFVQSVQYGRQIFIKFESSLSASKLETIINGHVKVEGLSAGGKTKIATDDELKKISISLIVLGGSEVVYEKLSLAGADKIEEINKIIFGKAKFATDNLGAPLNYYTVFLKDGTPAGVHGKTEYVEEKTERFTSGIIRLENHGGYDAKFNVTWKEIHYVKGVRTETDKSWTNNDNRCNAGYETEFALRGNCRKICIKAERDVIGGNWRTNGERLDLPLVKKRTVTLGGTTLINPSFKMDPSE